ncbi:GtrA family protein [Cellulomonas sp.]|uniref:GtrA family protein n=1 Tax=Cellulomonas sp. TaxID=40001 RepID=UPI002D7394DA|nr:GtrA family protein [Cellulomonas sp.]HYQ74696.1 GtrA family protein [Cellulomonas sp.]
MSDHEPRPTATSSPPHRQADHAGDASGTAGQVRRLRALTANPALRYLAVGGSAFLVDLGLTALLHEVLHLPVWLASGTAFVLSFAYTYTMQRFAFRASVPHGGALLRYSALTAINTVATALIVQAVSATPVGWVGGKVLATLVTTVWNYFAYRYWVFAGTSRGPGAARED